MNFYSFFFTSRQFRFSLHVTFNYHVIQGRKLKREEVLTRRLPTIFELGRFAGVDLYL